MFEQFDKIARYAKGSFEIATKCPHCLHAIVGNVEVNYVGSDVSGDWKVLTYNCPNCKRIVVGLACTGTNSQMSTTVTKVKEKYVVYPKGAARPIPEEVPDEYASEFREACLVLNDSPKASAALSRRLLQKILVEELGVKGNNLSQQINEAIKSGKLSPVVAKDLHAVREVGNLAAHPTKDTHTGEIIDVEPGEAEWLLDVLEALFVDLFVLPAESEKRREALNEKLRAAGRRELPDIEPLMTNSSEA